MRVLARSLVGAALFMPLTSGLLDSSDRAACQLSTLRRMARTWSAMTAPFSSSIFVPMGNHVVAPDFVDLSRAKLGVDVFLEDTLALVSASELLALPLHVILGDCLKGVRGRGCLLAALGQRVTSGRYGVPGGDSFSLGVVER